MSIKTYDVIIVGAGIGGLTIARGFVKRGIKKILVLEKEQELGMHASWRSSGVLHAGLYYATDSLKARFCADGARQHRLYAHEKSIPYKQTGKVVVAQDAASVSRLEQLRERAMANGVRIQVLTPTQLQQIEPEAQTTEFALFSPDTAVIDVKAVLARLRDELTVNDVTIRLNAKVIDVDIVAPSVRVDQEDIRFEHLVNCAGLFADRIAQACGVGMQYRIMPFRGSYKQLTNDAARQIRGSIYPTPDPRLPFLGVHLTRGVDGSILIGPTAFPAFGREHYRGLSGLDLMETPEILAQLLTMFFKNTDGLRMLVWAELWKRYPPSLVRSIRALTPFISSSDIIPSAKVGLRAQLVNTATGRFIMDFVVERGPYSTHVLNAVSPGFTCAFPFAEYVIDIALGITKPNFPSPV